MYTTRPKRNNNEEIKYNFVTKEFINGHKSEFVDIQIYKDWIYALHKSDVISKEKDKINLMILNPSAYRKYAREYLSEDDFVIYLKIDSRTALERMLERGDDIHEAYRRTVSDEGQFTGLEDELKHDMDKVKKAGKISSCWILYTVYLDAYNVFKQVDGLLDTHIETSDHFNLLSK